MSRHTLVFAVILLSFTALGCGSGGGSDDGTEIDSVDNFEADGSSGTEDPDRAPINPIDSQDGIINTAQNPDAQTITGDGYVLTVHDPLTAIRNQAAFGSPIRCRSGSYVLNAPGRDLVIDGKGRGACIRVERGCVTEINARSISLTNCRVCTEASRGSSLRLNATNGNMNCNSTRHAVDLQNASALSISSTSEITVQASQSTNAIRARTGSTVSLRAPGVCHVLGERGPLESDGTSRLDTSGCGQFDQGVIPTPTPTPTPRPTHPPTNGSGSTPATPTPIPIVGAGQCRDGMLLHTTGHPHHHGDGHGGCIAGNRTQSAKSGQTDEATTLYFAESISCIDQNLSFNNPAADLVIRGDGGPCLTASDSCYADISAKSITFANCQTCVEATDNSNVALHAAQGEITCAPGGAHMQSDETSEISLSAKAD